MKKFKFLVIEKKPPNSLHPQGDRVLTALSFTDKTMEIQGVPKFPSFKAVLSMPQCGTLMPVNVKVVFKTKKSFVVEFIKPTKKLKEKIKWWEPKGDTVLKLVLIFSFLFIGCGTGESVKEYKYNLQYSGESDLEKIIELYKTDKKKYLGLEKSFYDIKFQFVNTFFDKNGNKKTWAVKGSCARGGKLVGNNRLIRLKKSYWNEILFYDKKMLVYHELGHCDLDLDHYSGTLMQGEDLRQIDRNFDELVGEFFNLKIHRGIYKIAINSKKIMDKTNDACYTRIIGGAK